MKIINKNITKQALLLFFGLLMLFVPFTVSGEEAKLPSSEAYEVIKGNSTLPSEGLTGSEEAYARPGGNTIGGVKTPLEDVSFVFLIAFGVFYVLVVRYKKNRLNI
ncbi:hypothetical protein D0T53_05905 [Dysgonomonas sp. 216]|uniref:hypothetical protein n=1 Tax=Dysgonomonas sp. 216 TaxID=2302934 RepID=UPI0013D5B3D1|nr:hypothetical protein [Dysgonomonas sp. 216]NDW18448.1 hypothetical protein [Dysgonomonas sp. 216]